MNSTGSREAKARVALDKAEKILLKNLLNSIFLKIVKII